MGLFGKKRSKEEMLRWQKVFIPNVDVLKLNEKQLTAFTQEKFLNCQRILGDCGHIVQSTKNPDTFFSRLKLTKEMVETITQLQEFVKINGAEPSSLLEQYYVDEQEFISQFLRRYYSAEIDKVDALKTEKAKRKHLEQFKSSLDPYMDMINDKNKGLFEQIVKNYEIMI